VTARIRAGLLTPVRNGQMTGTIKLDPPSAEGFTCSNGQTLELSSVTYSNITVKGDAGTIAASPSSVVFTNPTVPQ
jgi:hypothetical protein